MANTWNQSGTTWGQNTYGTQTQVVITLTGVQSTSEIGSVTAANIEGWGRQSYGNSGWGVDYAVQPVGQQATSSIGNVTAFDTQTVIPTGQQAATGLGSLTLNLTSIVSLTGLQAQTELGTFDNAGTLVGWGRNGWGEEPYGDSFNSLVQLVGSAALTMTSNVGSLTSSIENFVPITGVQAATDVGSLGIVSSLVLIPSGQSATSSLGSISLDNITVGLQGLQATSAVGNLQSQLIQTATGVQAATSVGSLSLVLTSVIIPSGQSATSAVGSLLSEIGVPLTGVQSTSAVGAIAPTQTTLGLTGVEATSEVGTGLALQYFNRQTPKDSTGYTKQTPKNTTGYTRKTPKNTTGYTRKTA